MPSFSSIVSSPATLIETTSARCRAVRRRS
jgi:hypothetical protein